MGKLLNFFDRYALKFCVVFLIFFIALYPKLPSVHITHTWVYIRLEDFTIAATVIVWLIELLRRKVKLPWEIGSAIAAYWTFGFFSLVFSLIFIAPHLLNFFPTVAALSYLRRIEYMILFFVAFSSVRTIEDLKDYIRALIVTTLAFILYGFGQKFYIYLWNAFPAFFSKYQFCFPSFQTGNEEFAKGIPLCLPFDGRITSTFAGHYDLAAYLVLVIPIFIALIFTIKRKLYKAIFSLFTLSTIIILILTASRIAFPAYLIGSGVALTLIKKKKFIIPLVILSIVLLPLFSSSTFKRFLQTFRVTSVVVDSSGHVVGEALSPELRARLAQNNGIYGNIATQDLPEGTSFIGLPQAVTEKTDTAVVRSNLTPAEAKRLKLENGGVELSTIKGNFTLKKALVYDISLTTRFQAEWPNALHAFSRNILLGSGFSTITLATDNDFLRFLGESGVLGLFSFLFIFLMLFILFRRSFWKLKNPMQIAFSAGIAGGIIGLFLNASLFDIFESSKVAETMWILLGIFSAGLVIQSPEALNYRKEIRKVLLSHPFLIFYLVLLVLVFFIKSINNFFVADDFTWLKWAANFSSHDFLTTFTNAQGFFYRPLDKIIIFFLYALSSFNPSGYHIFTLLVHVITGIGVYLLVLKLSKNKLLSFVSSFIFLFLPIHAENVFWISSISPTISVLFEIYAILFYLHFRQKKSRTAYLISLLLFPLALFSYEITLIFPVILIVFDVLIFRLKPSIKNYVTYLPYILVAIIYVVLWKSSHAVGLGGDYSYSIPHLIPNFVGNFVGYLAAFVFGESALPYYNIAREFLKSQTFLSIGLIGLLVLVVSAALYYFRKRIVKVYRIEEGKLFIFGIIFAFVALIPFLGLGNISERYLYLGSVGLSLSFGILLIFISEKLGRLNAKVGSGAVALIILTLLGLFYFREVSHSNYEWQTAGKITNRTLSYLKIYDESVPSNSNLYFVNTPIKFQDAWVFPVGLPDGIWFIYSDNSLNIRNISSVQEAMKLRSQTPERKTYIFEFKNFKVDQVK